MDVDEDTQKTSKLYRSATFLVHLIYMGHQNIARTPAILQVGILLLHIAFVLYIVGFVSPYWVLGEKHRYKHDAWGNRLVGVDRARAGTGGNSSSFRQEQNTTHFGVWEECMEVEGESVCTIFTEDVDSVIIMFACVGGFILFGLCCWSCLSCVRKPRKGRYFFIVIAANVGGIFGLLSVVIFLVVQGRQRYSWAFALFLSACLLELCAAALFLWGIQRAQAQGAFPLLVEETADTTTLPAIVVTGPTPSRKGQARPVRVIQKGAAVKGRPRKSQRQEEDHVDFITLDMVSPVPDLPRTGKKKKKKKKMRKKNRKEKDEGFSSMIEKTNPVESLAQQVADCHKGYVNLRQLPPPRPPADTEATAPSPDASQPLLPATQQNSSGADPHEKPTSIYIDLTGASPTLPFPHARGERPEQFRRTGEDFCKSDGRKAQGRDSGRPLEPHSFYFVADVHQSDDLDDLFAFSSSRGEDPATELFPLKPLAQLGQGHGHDTLQTLAPQLPESSPPFPSRRSRTGSSLTGSFRTVVCPSSTQSNDRDVSDTASAGKPGKAKRKKKDEEESEYVSHYPDTYYQLRGSTGYYA